MRFSLFETGMHYFRHALHKFMHPVCISVIDAWQLDSGNMLLDVRTGGRGSLEFAGAIPVATRTISLHPFAVEEMVAGIAGGVRGVAIDAGRFNFRTMGGCPVEGTTSNRERLMAGFACLVRHHSGFQAFRLLEAPRKINGGIFCLFPPGGEPLPECASFVTSGTGKAGLPGAVQGGEVPWRSFAENPVFFRMERGAIGEVANGTKRRIPLE